MIKKIKECKILFILLAVVLLLTIFCYWENNAIEITDITYSSKKLPNAFYGYIIAQISDLHNKEPGYKQNVLLRKLKATNPDIIVITGDLIDRNHTDIDKALSFVVGAIKIAPVYYVSGNHEAWSGVYNQLKQQLTEVGVIVLDNEKVNLVDGEIAVSLLGISDPSFTASDYLEDNTQMQVKEQLDLLIDNGTSFHILLSHRPELINIYAQAGIDLVFTGHAHGGQFRLPFGGGLVAPNQGLFPKYTNGSYTEGNTTEIVSRGLGNSIMPIRIFNRPEIVVVTLKSK